MTTHTLYPAAAILAAAALLTVTVSGAQKDAPAAPRTVLEVMVRMTVPASAAIFDVGEAPKTDAQWKALRAHAVTLMDTGPLLLAPGRARDQGEWANQVRTHVDAAGRVAKAAEARNFDALLAASDAVAETCVTCHKGYLAK